EKLDRRDQLIILWPIPARQKRKWNPRRLLTPLPHIDRRWTLLNLGIRGRRRLRLPIAVFLFRVKENLGIVDRQVDLVGSGSEHALRKPRQKDSINRC